MLRVGIEDLVLQILILDLGEPTTFLKKALDPPTNLAMSNSLKLLEQLGAVECQWHPPSRRQQQQQNISEGYTSSAGDEDGLKVSSELTALGFHLATLPVDPRVGKMMIYGALFGCVDPLLTLAAAMSARSPFVSPFDQRDQADMARKKFAIEGSDHLTILNAFEQWSDLRRTTQGSRHVNSFLKENFLGRLTLVQMEDLRRQFHSLLADIGFLPRGFRLKDRDHPANGNSQNRGLIKAVLCAGLYPNIIVAPRSVVLSQGATNKGKQSSVVGEHAFRSHRKGDLYLHPSTVAFDEPQLDSRYCCYHELVRTSKTYVRDCTTVSPLALLLFGGTLETYPTHGVCAVDGWLKFRIQAKSATLIKYLRGKMERLLFEKIVSPHKDVIETGEGRAVIQSISLLFETDLMVLNHGPSPASTRSIPDRSGGEIVRPWNGHEQENKDHRSNSNHRNSRQSPSSTNDDSSCGRHGRGAGGRRQGRGRGRSRGGRTGRGSGSITG
jgi:HrpA-like RNA helicase